MSVVHCSMGRLVDRLHLALDNQERRMVDKDIREEITMEWKHCALVIDRCDHLIYFRLRSDKKMGKNEDKRIFNKLGLSWVKLSSSWDWPLLSFSVDFVW